MADSKPRQPGVTPLKPAASTRPPLAEIKPPREWRSSRSVEERRVPAPRVLKAMPMPLEPTPEGALPDMGSAAVTGSAHLLAPAPAMAPMPPPVDLPTRYGVDRLAVLVRDPWWVYAWWELTAGNLTDGRQMMGADAALVLRVYDVSAILWDGTNHHSHFDVGIEDHAGCWYLELGKPGASFLAEIGLRAPDGRFLALVRSNAVSLPRDGVSDVVDEEWMVLGEAERELFERAGGGSFGPGSGELSRLLEQRLRTEMASGLSSRAAASPGASGWRPGT